MQHVEKHFTGGETVRDVVIGMADGLTVPFALAAGISGAIASTPDYKLAAVKTPETLEVIVNEFLKDGYELYGSPFCSADRYCQAIVKYNESGK